MQEPLDRMCIMARLVDSAAPLTGGNYRPWILILESLVFIFIIIIVIIIIIIIITIFLFVSSVIDLSSLCWDPRSCGQILIYYKKI